MKTFQELKRASKKSMPGPDLKVAILGDSATQLLSMAIKGNGSDRGYNITIWEADYNQIDRQILDPSSEYHQFAPDYTVIFQSSQKLLEKYSQYDVKGRCKLCNDRIAFIESIIPYCKGKIIYFNYPEIDDCVFGNYSNKTVSSFIFQQRLLNVKLMEIAQSITNFHICDLASLQSKFGRDRMVDTNVYIGTEILISIDILPYVASRIIDIISSIQGKFKKCLICDLDNTLWGGIIGDDGWENIQIGHGLGIGKAFTEFQQWIKKLKERGVILAVCSKNDESIAKEAFEKNPEMVLKLDDISVFIANWDNKVNNIRKIQQILNIGEDSIVFLDDNPFERNIVRENIPEITVPELPEDPADYLEFLYAENLFETASYSEQDVIRGKQYQIEAQRQIAKSKFTNEDDFLKSLNMECVVEGFTKFNTPRVAQLSQRSNQFNFRTIRYSEEDIRKIENDKEHYATFSFSLRDKFGDNGLICVIILEKINKDSLFICTWFMSCRVLKRGMENFTINTIVDYARHNGFKRIIGEYIPTPKNKLVEDLYSQLGFKKLEKDSSSHQMYELNISQFIELHCNIKKVSK